MNTSIACLALSFCNSPVLPRAACVFSTQLARFTVPASAFGFSAAHSSFSKFLAPVLAVSAYTQQAFVSSPPTLSSVFSDCTFTSIVGNCIYVKDPNFVLRVERCGFCANAPSTSCIFFIEGSSVSIASSCFDACTGIHPGYAVCSHDHEVYHCTVNSTNEVASVAGASSFAGGRTYFAFQYNNVTATVSESNRAGFCLTRSAADAHHCKCNTCLNNTGTESFTIYHSGAFHTAYFVFVDNTQSQSLVRFSTYAAQLTMERCVFIGNTAAATLKYPLSLADQHPTVSFVSCGFDCSQFAWEAGVTVGDDCSFNTVASTIVYPTFNPSVCYALGSPVATDAFTAAARSFALQQYELLWVILAQ